MTTLRSKPVDPARHYVLHPDCWNWWFNASPSRLLSYEARFRDDFCFVLERPTTTDAYIIPWPIARRLFDESTRTSDGRWIGTVVDDELRLVSNGQRRVFPIGRFKNAFEFLDLFGRQQRTAPAA